MPPMNGAFDATQYNPEQGIGKHPVGKKFPAVVKSTSVEATKDNSGGYFSVVFETPAGQIIKNYNLWNNNTTTVEIAQKQLSALCHATGIFKLEWPNEGAAMRGGQLMIDVDQQTKNPEYNEVSKVYDRHGNEPGKPANAAPQPQQAAPVAPIQANGGWGANLVQQGTQPAQQQPAWTQQQPQAGTETPPWKR